MTVKKRKGPMIIVKGGGKSRLTNSYNDGKILEDEKEADHQWHQQHCQPQLAKVAADDPFEKILQKNQLAYHNPEFKEKQRKLTGTRKIYEYE